MLVVMSRTRNMQVDMYDDDDYIGKHEDYVSGYEQNEYKSRKYDSGDEGNQVVILILITLDSHM